MAEPSKRSIDLGEWFRNEEILAACSVIFLADLTFTKERIEKLTALIHKEASRARRPRWMVAIAVLMETLPTSPAELIAGGFQSRIQ